MSTAFRDQFIQPTVETVAPVAAPTEVPQVERGAGAPTPAPVPSLETTLRRSTTLSAPARQGWQGRVNRLLRTSLGPGALERAERRDVGVLCSNMTRALRVMVANPKGAAGKTPTSRNLAGVIGHYRGGGVVYVDNNELRGDGGRRSEDGGCSLTVREMLDDPRVDGVRREDVDRYLRPQSSGHHKVLASAHGGSHSISFDEFLRVDDLLTRFYEVLVIDTGNHEQAGNWLAAAKVADRLVVPTKWKETHCVAADLMLDQLIETGHRHLVKNAIVVGTNGPGDTEKQAQVYRDHFARKVRAVVDIPTDPHIHGETVIRWGQLSPATQRAYLQLGALLFEQQPGGGALTNPAGTGLAGSPITSSIGPSTAAGSSTL